MNSTYVLLILLVLCWTVNPFMKKQVASKMSSSEYMIFNHCLCSLIIIIYLLYLLKTKNFSINSIKLLSKKDIGISIAAAITTVMATIFLISLLKNNDASYVIPHVQPVVIVFTMLLGYFVYNENITFTKGLGTVMIVAGLFLMNSKK